MDAADATHRGVERCGKRFSYKTNLTAERVTHTCLACKAPVDLELNSRKTAYVTVGERR